MGRKMLFIFGILLAHGALGAGWVARDAPRHREAVITSCARFPSAPLHIAPPREMLAFTVIPANVENEVLHP